MPEETELSDNLQKLGWSTGRLEALSNIPDTSAALDEIERTRHRRALLRNLNNAFRHGRRPRIAADITIEGIRTVARTEVDKLRREEREIAARFHQISRRLKEITRDRRSAERLLAEAGVRADRERCDPSYVNLSCA